MLRKGLFMVDMGDVVVDGRYKTLFSVEMMLQKLVFLKKRLYVQKESSIRFVLKV